VLHYCSFKVGFLDITFKGFPFQVTATPPSRHSSDNGETAVVRNSPVLHGCPTVGTVCGRNLLANLTLFIWLWFNWVSTLGSSCLIIFNKGKLVCYFLLVIVFNGLSDVNNLSLLWVVQVRALFSGGWATLDANTENGIGFSLSSPTSATKEFPWFTALSYGRCCLQKKSWVASLGNIQHIAVSRRCTVLIIFCSKRIHLVYSTIPRLVLFAEEILDFHWCRFFYIRTTKEFISFTALSHGRCCLQKKSWVACAIYSTLLVPAVAQIYLFFVPKEFIWLTAPSHGRCCSWKKS